MSNLILTGSLLGWVGSKINTAVQSFFLWIDSVVYWFASSCYQLFIKLSTAEIFSDSFFSNFANRIYAILGIFMLFYLAYALLNAIIDPDKLTKGDKSVSKLASNFVVSLVIIGLLPTIFSYAYNLQNFILSENVIGTLVFGTKATANEDGMVQFGDALSFTVLNTFINPQNYNVLIADDYTWFNLKQDIIENNEYGALNGLADAIVNGANVIEENGTSSETVYVEYKVILSTLVGVYLCYIMISFCLDLGVRLVKLAFCQLIAPIPVIMRAMPSKKGTFDKWLKLTLSVYFEVFVRVGIIYLSVYFINEIVSNNELMNVFSYSGGGIQGMLALVIIILGILTFAKQAPKMISDILGIDTGNMKLGITDKLKAGGFFVGGAMLGAGATGLARNSYNALNNVGRHLGQSGARFENTWNNARATGGIRGIGMRGAAIGRGLVDVAGTAIPLIGGAASAAAGATSGAFNAYKPAKDAKNFKDMKKAASTGANTAQENRINRENFKAVNNGTVGAAKARAVEVADSVKTWATGTGFSGTILNKIKFRDGLKEVYDNSYKALFETPPYKNMDALLNDYKAKSNAGVAEVDGQPLKDYIDANGNRQKGLISTLEDKLTQMRYDTIRNNRQATAYAVYNIAQYMKDNPKEAREADFNLNGIDANDIILKNNDVYRRSTNAPLSEAELRQIFEAVDMNGNTIINAQGVATKGVKAQVKTLNDENKGLKQSIEYKEYQKREEASKKKKN